MARAKPAAVRRSSTIVKVGSLDLSGRRTLMRRTSGRADARRGRERQSRHQLTRVSERDEYARQERDYRSEKRAAAGPHHFYGAWTPPGMPAWAGGHPGRALRRAHRAAKHHARRAHRAATVAVPRTVRKAAHVDVATAAAELEARMLRNMRALGRL